MSEQMSEAPSIQWFPGHMAKTRRLIGESLPLVDLVAEIIDARIPASSRNPELDGWLKDKPRLLLLNKCDCADENATRRWLEYYQTKSIAALAIDCKSGRGVDKVGAGSPPAAEGTIGKADGKRNCRTAAADDGGGYPECRKILAD